MDSLTVTAGVFAVTVTGTVCAGIGAAWWYRRRARRAEAVAALLRRQLRVARHAARHDPLTGLPNRRALDELGPALMADPARLPLIAILIDLDDFKRVNDSLGHAVGDEVLVVLAQRLAAYAAGNLVARLGGDEFALLSRAWTAGQAGYPDPAELARIVATPMHIAGHQVRVTASIGVATARDPAGLAALIRDADAAMYRAKRIGRYPTYTPTTGDDHGAHPPALAVRGRTDDAVAHAGTRADVVGQPTLRTISDVEADQTPAGRG